MTTIISISKPQQKKKDNSMLLSGAEAIARGAIESNITAATAYPGLESGVIDYLALDSKKFKIRLEWTTNERVAIEIAGGIALGGLRALVFVEHVGLNVASDSLLHLGLIGVNGGLVIVTGDDIGGIGNATIEQDNRYYSLLSHIPMLEPSSPQEAKDMVIDAFDMSEKYSIPVIIRVTSEILFMREKIIYGNIKKRRKTMNFNKDINHYFLLGENIVKHHIELHKKLKKISRTEGLILNKIEGNTQQKYIISSGASYLYLKEAFKVLKVNPNHFSILKIGMPNPVSIDVILNFLKGAKGTKNILLLEENEPILEDRISSILNANDLHFKILGRINGYIPIAGKLSTDIVCKILSRTFNMKSSNTTFKSTESAFTIPSRELMFCAGCPHRGSMYALKNALKEICDNNYVVIGDIGCYALGAYSPFNVIDTNINMGSSIGLATGLAYSNSKDHIIAVIGDATFLHSGIPPLLDAKNSGAKILVYVVDNGVSGLTGGQKIPYLFNQAPKIEYSIDLTSIIIACGVTDAIIVDPYNLYETTEALKKCLLQKSFSVIIAKRKCATAAKREMKIGGERRKTAIINSLNCNSCGICINNLGCPALYWDTKKVKVDQIICFGCGLCIQVCPCKAITI